MKTNREVADILNQIGDMLDILGDDRFKVLAYRRAAESIEALGQDVHSCWQAGALRDIPGVGKAIEEKIDELMRTGHLEYYERLQDRVPLGVLSLLDVPNVGPKTAHLLWERLGIQGIAGLEDAARGGRLRELPGLGPKAEAKILSGIEMLRRRSGRVPLGTAWPVAQELLDDLRRSCPAVDRTAAAGSLRRMRSTIGDIDLLAASEEPDAVMRAFVALPAVGEVLLSGMTKTSVRLHNGLQADLRVVPSERWGTALQYFTGSREHNVRLREIAQKKGLSLSEYGFKREDGSDILCREEAEVYGLLDLACVPPELREDRGEVQAAAEGRLPRLVESGDIQGDLHTHSTWSDGAGTIAEMAAAARGLGYGYLVVSDHTQSLGIARGLTAERLLAQRAELDASNREGDGFVLLQGCELEIKADGSLDFPDEVLSGLDFVVASVHSSLQQDVAHITQRVLGALHNPYVDVIGHPSGRLLGRREESAVDLDAVIQAAAETGTALEVNSSPDRLDLEDVYVRRAVSLGVPISIGSDAHHPAGLESLPYGIATARRGWATPDDVLNTKSWQELRAWRQARIGRQRTQYGGE